MEDSYYSIEKHVSSEFKEKGSKFFSFAFPVQNESDIKAHLQELKVKYWDASHHCYAYMLGPKKEIFRANDAGEPNHTAGDPILSQIKSFNLTNVLVVVVRYFGGTKLGVSGLISAYKTSAKEVLEKASIIERYLTSHLILRFVPDHTSLVMKTIKQVNAEVLAQEFDSETIETSLTVLVRKTDEELLFKNLEGTFGIKVSRRN